MGLLENDTLLHQPVDIGRASQRVAQGVDRIGALIVGYEQHDVRSRQGGV